MASRPARFHGRLQLGHQAAEAELARGSSGQNRFVVHRHLARPPNHAVARANRPFRQTWSRTGYWPVAPCHRSKPNAARTPCGSKAAAVGGVGARTLAVRPARRCRAEKPPANHRPKAHSQSSWSSSSVMCAGFSADQSGAGRAIALDLWPARTAATRPRPERRRPTVRRRSCRSRRPAISPWATRSARCTPHRVLRRRGCPVRGCCS